MPAGPSEVLVIADSGATPDFVASDLLSQAEHGPDSQVILLTPAADMARRVAEAVERQLAELPRAETARQALSASRLIVTNDLAQCVEISNQYGPEHLIIQTRNARDWSMASPAPVRYFLVTGHRNRQVITPPEPTMFYRLTVTPPPVPASARRISEAYDRAGTVERRFLRAGFDH